MGVAHESSPSASAFNGLRRMVCCIVVWLRFSFTFLTVLAFTAGRLSVIPEGFRTPAALLASYAGSPYGLGLIVLRPPLTIFSFLLASFRFIFLFGFSICIDFCSSLCL